MAVPKKRTSKSKKNLRKTVWKKKAVKQVAYARLIMVKSSTKLDSPIPADLDSSGIGFGKNLKVKF
jgi:Ribosomal L32p protein family